MPRKPEPDLEVENHGTLFLLYPRTTEGQLWVNEHLPAATWGEAVAVEHRYIRDIVQGAVADGLTVR